MKRVCLQLSILLVSLFMFSAVLYAHCEIPCGIYDDEMRVKMISEHIKTIEKSMKQIDKLEKGEASHHSNQIVRWVTNKEDHANQLQDIVTQYFMTQRIKFDTNGYEKKLGILHHMLVYTMKCKQTTDMANIEASKSRTRLHIIEESISNEDPQNTMHCIIGCSISLRSCLPER